MSVPMRRVAALSFLFALAPLALLAQEEGAPAEPAPPAPTSPPVGVSAFPLEQGRAWTYQVAFSIRPIDGAPEGSLPEDGDAGEHRLDVSVTEPIEVAGRLAAQVEYKLDQDLAQRSYYVVEDGFLVCVRRLQGFAERIKPYDFTPVQKVLPAELEVGQKWTWEGKAGPEEGKQTFEVLRTEKVETPAGTFDAFVVEAKFEGEDDSSGVLTRWVVPGVGVVKEITEIEGPVQVFRTQGVLVRWRKP